MPYLMNLGDFELSLFIAAIGGSAITVYGFVKAAAHVLVMGDVSVSTAEESTEAMACLIDVHEQKQERLMEKFKKRFGHVEEKLAELGLEHNEPDLKKEE